MNSFPAIDAIVPFSTTKKQAVEASMDWLATTIDNSTKQQFRKKVPFDLFSASTFTPPAGLYLPFYLLEVAYDASWSAQSGVDRKEIYTEHVKTIRRIGDQTVEYTTPETRSRIVTDWTPISGTRKGTVQLLHFGWDLAAETIEDPALLTLSSFLKQAEYAAEHGLIIIGSADLTNKSVFASHFLGAAPSLAPHFQKPSDPPQSGFAVTDFSLSAEQSLADADRRIDAIIGHDCSVMVPGKVRGLTVSATKTLTSVKKVLLPFWIISYEYKGTKHQIVLDGQNARTPLASEPEDHARAADNAQLEKSQQLFLGGFALWFVLVVLLFFFRWMGLNFFSSLSLAEALSYSGLSYLPVAFLQLAYRSRRTRMERETAAGLSQMLKECEEAKRRLLGNDQSIALSAVAAGGTRERPQASPVTPEPTAKPVTDAVDVPMPLAPTAGSRKPVALLAVALMAGVLTLLAFLMSPRNTGDRVEVEQLYVSDGTLRLEATEGPVGLLAAGASEFRLSVHYRGATPSATPMRIELFRNNEKIQDKTGTFKHANGQDTVTLGSLPVPGDYSILVYAGRDLLRIGRFSLRDSSLPASRDAAPPEHLSRAPTRQLLDARSPETPVAVQPARASGAPADSSPLSGTASGTPLKQEAQDHGTGTFATLRRSDPPPCLDEDLKWRQAKWADTVQAYTDFLAACPNSPHASVAQASMTRLVGLAGTASGDPDPSTCPDEDLEWRTARSEGTMQAYRTFLANCPDSRHATTAGREIDELLGLADTRRLVSALLAEAPQEGAGASRRVEDVKGQLAALPRAERKRSRESRAANDRGLEKIQAGDIPGATVEFRRAYELDPNDPEVTNNLGSAYFRSGDLALAEAYLLKAIFLAPARASAWANLAETYALQGRQDLAVAAFAATFRFSRNQDTTRRVLAGYAADRPEPEIRAAAGAALSLPLLDEQLQGTADSHRPTGNSQPSAISTSPTPSRSVKTSTSAQQALDQLGALN